MQVDKQKFDALMAKLITTPASAKDGIKKPKPQRLGQSLDSVSG